MMRVLRGLLRPLARTLIARGITAPAFYRLLKSVYVDVAEADFALDDKPMTDSRVSMLTGVHRRDVRAIRQAEEEPWDQTRQKTTVLATVIGRWLGDPDFQNESGKPRLLPNASSKDPSFEALVRRVNKDVRPRTVLDEMLRQNLIEEVSDGQLRLMTEGIIGTNENDQQVVFFASNVGDHLAAASENLLADEPPFLERAVFYNGLTQVSVAEIEAEARDLSQDTLVKLNTLAQSKQTQDQTKDKATQRFRYGVYFFHTSANTNEAAPEPKDKGPKT